MKRTLVVAVLAAAILAPAADAHNATAKLGYRSTIEKVEPRMPGLIFKILSGDDQVWLDNRSGKTVVIKGYSGEPYLRFAPTGIFVNIRSPTSYLNQDRYARVEVPKSANAKAKPKWEKLAGGDVWAWHDHRIHYMNPIPPAADQGRAATSGTTCSTGRCRRRRTARSSSSRAASTTSRLRRDDFPYGLVISLAALVGAGMIGLFALRRVLIRSLKQ